VTTGIDFLYVPEHVARNPVARAIARARMVDAARAFSIRLRLLKDGEDASADLQAAAQVLAVAMRICDSRGESDSPNSRVMKGGMSALVSLATRKGSVEAARRAGHRPGADTGAGDLQGGDCDGSAARASVGRGAGSWDVTRNSAARPQDVD
jgi:hypothetical protein